jgi:hypothetical protein
VNGARSVPSGFNFPDELTTFAFNVTPYLPSISPLTPNSSVRTARHAQHTLDTQH